MTSSYVCQYLVPCITESANVFTGYRSTVPTTCPNNNTHTINTSGIQVVDTIDRNSVAINQNTSVSVFGFYRVDSYSIPVPANTTTTYNISYPYNVTAYSTILMPSADNVGDSLTIIALPYTTFAGLIAPLATGATALNSSSIANLNPGFYLYVTNGVVTDALGEITSLGNTGANIGFSVPTVNSFSPGSYLQLSVPRIDNYVFCTTENLIFGLARKASTGLPAGQIVQIIYTNNSNVDKTFNVAAEIGY